MRALPALLLFLTLLAAPVAAEAGSRRDPCPRLGGLQALLEHLSERFDSPFLARFTEKVQRRVADRCVALNEVQVIGTHNSYHLPPQRELLEAFVSIDPSALEWEYEHLPLFRQFDEQGIRQIELDVFADPEGGLFANRFGLQLIGEDPASGLPELDEPGFKVIHVQDLDFETTCLTLIACLEELKAFSDAHPKHLPVLVLLEAKEDAILPPPFAQPIVFGPDEFRDLEAEILTVFPRDRIVTPDFVRGKFASVEEAVTARGWPKLGQVRGKVVFLLDNAAKRDAYVDGDPSLAGRLIFPNTPPGSPDAAFVKANDPESDPTLIPELVQAGYLVRTRADAGLAQARSGDRTRSETALASGAQAVSTDYPEPSRVVSIDPSQPFDPSYRVELPGGGVARCNPVNAPPWCRGDALERH
ncbi:MAG: phosphatidylinositol-specific phospholipase C1-like protein [Proteobacteria bacterium]|nr:phosphatidylinositol-specific phospholipase C1-like protein [Pseudomonadota bacterium]